MRRISLGIITLALALTFVAPLTASAASPSRYSMFREQVASQPMISALLNRAGGQALNTFYFRTLYKSSVTAALSVGVVDNDGSKFHGVAVLRKFAGTWYFTTITRGDHSAGVSIVPMPDGLTSYVVNNAMREQADNQYVLGGLITGGYKKLTVRGRSNNVSTSRVDIRLSGGRRHARNASVYAYAEVDDNANTFWFINTLR